MKTEELRRCTEGRKVQRNTIASTEVDTNPASSPRNLPERNFENGKGSFFFKQTHRNVIEGSLQLRGHWHSRKQKPIYQLVLVETNENKAGDGAQGCSNPGWRIVTESILNAILICYRAKCRVLDPLSSKVPGARPVSRLTEATYNHELLRALLSPQTEF